MPIVTARLSAQFLSFAIIGVLGTGVHYLVLVMLVSGAGIAPVVATTVGAFCGAIVNYVLNYRLTFESRKRHAEALSKFLAVAGVGFVINAAIVAAGTRRTTWHYLVIQVIATALVLFWGFAANRMWTFRGNGNARQ
jgi:putative flippase GtrA